MWERWFAAIALGLVLLCTPMTLASGISAFAVLLTFSYVQVADRLAEAQKVTPLAAVECYPKLLKYLVLKEIAWVLVWIETGAWSALAGSALFLGYPVWRRWYRSAKPHIGIVEPTR